ncbi:hypothetical protein GCM10010420_30950 [Streptomyces glaucosporus]|uniref:Uncharacterized protein n=1 Tax=Streptomyces glaucosporus TaxID=284044 RepID=A0ABP5VHK3_9ACTN
MKAFAQETVGRPSATVKTLGHFPETSTFPGRNLFRKKLHGATFNNHPGPAGRGFL